MKILSEEELVKAENNAVDDWLLSPDRKTAYKLGEWGWNIKKGIASRKGVALAQAEAIKKDVKEILDSGKWATEKIKILEAYFEEIE